MNHSSESEDKQVIQIYFKLVFTDKFKYYPVNVKWTFNTLFINLDYYITRDFNITHFVFTDNYVKPDYGEPQENSNQINIFNRKRLDQIYSKDQLASLVIYIRNTDL
jgi:hypothetical protein